LSFEVAADAYDRYMGRYSAILAPLLADFAGIWAGQRALDVGCGPGVLVSELEARLGAENVAAVDPSEPFVAACRDRHPDADVRQGSAEALPWPDDLFDAALAQLVVHFMADPVAGLAEMARVTRPGGVVAACVWDFEGGRGPIDVFWTAARELDPDVEDESTLAGVRQGHLVELLTAAGLGDVVEAELPVVVEHASFEEWWSPFTLGVGPGGMYAAGLDAEHLQALEERCRELAPDPFRLVAVAWAARGTSAG
jgi:SAM-dependent methyltransferase